MTDNDDTTTPTPGRPLTEQFAALPTAVQAALFGVLDAVIDTTAEEKRQTAAALDHASRIEGIDETLVKVTRALVHLLWRASIEAEMPQKVRDVNAMVEQLIGHMKADPAGARRFFGVEEH